MKNHEALTIDRRTAIKWVMAASAALGASTTSFEVFGASSGYGKDPDILKVYKPGELWPLVLTSQQKQTSRVLCDTIIPRDGDTPAASQVGAVEFIDEWISAPYDTFSKDRSLIISGLAWIEKEAQRRYDKAFVSLSEREIAAICDDISPRQDAKAVNDEPAIFFARFRTLTAIAYYTTPVGMKDIGYVGNVPLREYVGPPTEVMKKIGLV